VLRVDGDICIGITGCCRSVSHGHAWTAGLKLNSKTRCADMSSFYTKEHALSPCSLTQSSSLSLPQGSSFKFRRVTML
jgi:hypothetical protein